jgi:hypothetical protein
MKIFTILGRLNEYAWVEDYCFESEEEANLCAIYLEGVAFNATYLVIESELVKKGLKPLIRPLEPTYKIDLFIPSWLYVL